MTPKEKARELVNQFLEKIPFADTNVYEDWKKEMNDKAKQCALIAVDEILYVLNEIDSTEQWNASWFYNEIKQQIIKL